MASAKQRQRAEQLRAATTRATAPTPYDPPDGESGPLVDLEEDAYDPEKVERVHMFTLGGVKYTVPSQVPASLALEMLARTAEDGAEETMWWVFNEVLGEDAVEALRCYPRLSMTKLGQIFAACESIITGSFSDPKSPRPGAASRR